MNQFNKWTEGLFAHIRDSIVVSISACHADDPGSIPGRGVFDIIYFDFCVLLVDFRVGEVPRQSGAL